MADPYTRPGFHAPKHTGGADHGTPHERLKAKTPTPPKPKPWGPHSADQNAAGATTPEMPPVEPAGEGATVPQAAQSDDETPGACPGDEEEGS